MRLSTKRLRVPLFLLLVLGLGGLVVLGIGGVIAVTLNAAVQNTVSLIEDKSRLIVGSVVARTRQHLDPAYAQTGAVARLVESGALEPDDSERLAEILSLTLAGVRQVDSLLFIATDGTMTIASRRGDEVRVTEHDWRGDAEVERAVDQGLDHGTGAFWGAPAWAKEPGPLVNLRRPVLRAGVYLGLVVATVEVRSLAGFIDRLATEVGQQVFILHGTDDVLAHPLLAEPFPGLDAGHPLPSLAELGDPVLAAIWRNGADPTRQLLPGVRGHTLRVDGERYVYLYEQVHEYADAPWLVGSYFRQGTAGIEIERLTNAAIVALVALAAAVAIAFLLGRTIGRPALRLAEAAAAVRDLEIWRAPNLPRSRIREFDEASAAFRSMLAVLQIFGRYVPRMLVLQLMRNGDGQLASELRDVTVMFADIAGFTALAETMPAEELAALVNAHFQTLAECVEAEGGTVDKFLGDGLMAFWNAPERQPDHADRAVRAAASVVAAYEGEAAARLPAGRLRIGIHTGVAVVGNIGSTNRMNYTLIGDTVNIAQRIQEMGKILPADGPVTVLLSEETADRLAGRPQLADLGPRRLRGRTGPLRLFRLEPC
ncbi:adenylate/guanylate cyclase domain-containing protein [Geminicoccaceae bacterium 1502E]|nr:adenylate/guanylate cyclase domain-containing protein [Geminicoccaceae bacterium 1502E]